MTLNKKSAPKSMALSAYSWKTSVLLPGVFPIAEHGDIPGELELFLVDDDPRESVDPWSE